MLKECNIFVAVDGKRGWRGHTRDHAKLVGGGHGGVRVMGEERGESAAGES